MRILALYAAKNAHGNDATGAFVPQSIRFERARKAAGDTVVRVGFDPTIPDRAARRRAFLDAIRGAGKVDAVVYFGHGLRTGLPSAGLTTATLGQLVDALHEALPSRAIVTLYACSTAGAPGRDRDKLDGDGGFADLLRDRLSELGHTGWIDAHTVAGHTTINRMTRRFYLDGKAAGTGGAWLVAPGSPEWRAWGDALKGDESFRFSFPYLTATEIHARLAAR